MSWLGAELAYQQLERTGYTDAEIRSVAFGAGLPVTDGAIADATAYTSLVAEFDADRAANTPEKRAPGVRQALQTLGRAASVTAATNENDFHAGQWTAS